MGEEGGKNANTEKSFLCLSMTIACTILDKKENVTFGVSVPL